MILFRCIDLEGRQIIDPHIYSELSYFVTSYNFVFLLLYRIQNGIIYINKFNDFNDTYSEEDM